MSIKIFGIPGSRADRSLWAIEETGIEYEHIKTNFGEDSKSSDFLSVNPNGRIPALVDKDLQLCESMAINLYLAKHYAPNLYPTNANDEALTHQWSVWGISEIEPLQMQIVVQKFFIPTEKQDQAVVDKATISLARPLNVLNQSLEGREYLIGEHFQIADLNLASVMLLLRAVKLDLTEFKNVSQWLDRCHSRPALKRAQAL